MEHEKILRAVFVDKINHLFGNILFSPRFEIYNHNAGIKILGSVADISDTAKYFNSGIMIIDFEPWRKQNISKKVIDFINENSSEDFLVFHDQDALNAILYDQWHELHPRWNAQTHIIMNEKTHHNAGIKILGSVADIHFFQSFMLSGVFYRRNYCRGNIQVP